MVAKITSRKALKSLVGPGPMISHTSGMFCRLSDFYQVSIACTAANSISEKDGVTLAWLSQCKREETVL